jgi:hypothetical protein
VEQPAVIRSEPAPQGVGPLFFHDQEATMSRYTITVTRDHRSDPDAVIGYDPPLGTFFLQAFPHVATDDPALWLGTYDQAFRSLTVLHAAALVEGYDFMPLPEDVAARLAHDQAQDSHRAPHDGPLTAFLRRLHPD